MGSVFDERQASRTSIWSFLFRPMLVASLALHGLVLLLPVPSGSEAEAEETEDEEVTDLSSLIALPEPAPSPSPSPLPSPEAIQPTPVPSPLPTPAIVPTPVPQYVPVPVPVPEPVPSPTPEPQASPTPEPEQASAPTPTPTPTPMPTPLGLSPEQLQAYQGLFEQFGARGRRDSQGQRQTVNAARSVEISCSLLGQQAASFFTDCGGPGGEPQRKPEIFQMFQYPRTGGPDIALQELQQETGLTITDTGKQYADLPLYEISQENQPPIYMNLIGWGLGNSSTIVVLWSSDPTESPGSNQPTEE